MYKYALNMHTQIFIYIYLFIHTYPYIYIQECGCSFLLQDCPVCCHPHTPMPVLVDPSTPGQSGSSPKLVQPS